MKRKWTFLFLFILLLYLGMELIFPVLAEYEFRNVIKEQVENVEKLEVDIDSFPAWEIFLSRIDRVHLRAREVEINNLKITEIDSLYHDVNIKDEEITGINRDLKIVITEKALNNYIRVKYPSLKNFTIVFNPDSVLLSGKLNIFEKEIRLKLAGEFTVRELNKVIFIPRDLQIEELQIPGSLIKKFIEDLNFSFSLADMGVPMRVEEIKITSNELFLLGGSFVGKAGLK